MHPAISAIAACCLSASFVSAQEFGMPGMIYPDMSYAGMGYSGMIGGQLYPFDRQDPWLHGHFQRMPAYGGFNSFRPYNYRQVFAQTHIASGVWGAAHGHPYSQQFWNRYRADYLNGNPHSQASAPPASEYGVGPASYQTQPALPQQPPTDAPPAAQSVSQGTTDGRPISVYPAGILKR